VSRRGRTAEQRFTSPLHDTRIAAILGIALGVSFSICFVTGLLSYLIQHPPSWFVWPSRPAGLYRVTQGAHVITGFVSIPLLLAKLWVVSPRLLTWPPVRNVAHAVERLSLVPLVGGAIPPTIPSAGCRRAATSRASRAERSATTAESRRTSSRATTRC
jgi:hypothetical protein